MNAVCKSFEMFSCMIIRHKALTLGRVMADSCCEGMTTGELLELIEDKDPKVMRNITTFCSQLPGSRGFWRVKTKELIAFGRGLEYLSDGKERLNVFLTFRCFLIRLVQGLKLIVFQFSRCPHG